MLFAPYRRVFEQLRAVLRPAAAFEIWSTLIFVVSFAPASAWLMNWLVARSGQYAISDNDLVVFFLSMHGILFLLLSIGFVLAFWFAEQAGSRQISAANVFPHSRRRSMLLVAVSNSISN